MAKKAKKKTAAKKSAKEAAKKAVKANKKAAPKKVAAKKKSRPKKITVAKVPAGTRKIQMGEDRIPKAWYNIMADLPVPLPPPLHPGTHQPIGPGDLAPLFPMGLIMQEVATDRYIDIPKPVTDIYKMWRPTPLYRAYGLEKALGTTAKIYYKYEGVSPAGSHKPNTAVPQAFYNQQEGVKKLVTETGAGQWGTSLAMAGAMFGIDVKVFQVGVSFRQKPYRKAVMDVARNAYPARRWKQMRAAKFWRRIQTPTAPSALPFLKPSKWRPPMTTPNMLWARC
jgi:predicted alternative tryptophan synthase beta-subunit